MLGLGEKIHRDPRGIRSAVGNDEDLRWSGDHVDTHDTKHPPLRRRDVGVTRTDDLVHLRHGLGAIGESADRLRTAHGEHPVHPTQAGGCKDQPVLLAMRGRHRHHDLAHPGDLCRNAVHQHGRRISRFAARHVESDTIEGRHALPQPGPVAFGKAPRLLDLTLVKGAGSVRPRAPTRPAAAAGNWSRAACRRSGDSSRSRIDLAST